MADRRSGYWLRLYECVLHDEKVQSLEGNMFKVWINILLATSANGGTVPELKKLAFVLRVSEKTASNSLARVREAGLIDEISGSLVPHNWDKWQYKSDNSTPRVRKWRALKATQTGNVVTLQKRSRNDDETL